MLIKLKMRFLQISAALIFMNTFPKRMNLTFRINLTLGCTYGPVVGSFLD